MDVLSLLIIQTHTSIVKHKCVCAHEKQTTGPAGWLSQNQGFSHLPYTTPMHAAGMMYAHSTEVKSTHYKLQPHDSLSPPSSPGLQEGCESRNEHSLSHIHI